MKPGPVVFIRAGNPAHLGKDRDIGPVSAQGNFHFYQFPLKQFFGSFHPYAPRVYINPFCLPDSSALGPPCGADFKLQGLIEINTLSPPFFFSLHALLLCIQLF